MARALFVLVLLFAYDAFGRSVEMPIPGAVDLGTGSPAEVGRGDLSISDGLIRAPYGIRMASAGPQRLMMLPLVLQAPLYCRASDGRDFRVTVMAYAGHEVILEVLGEGESPAPPPALRGAYVLSGMAVDGLVTDLSMPPLRLLPDGSYQLGSARGRFQQQPRWLVLDGYYQSWGRAEISGGGEELVFRFRRGGHTVQAVLRRVEEVPERALVATP